MEPLLFGPNAHVIFDLDGTLTVAMHDFAALREAVGVPAGQPILEHLATLPSDERAARLEVLDTLEAALCERARAAEGAEALLAHLAAGEARLGIVTRNTRDNAFLTLAAAGLSAYFAPSDVLGRYEAPQKPDPAGLVWLATQWGCEPASCVMVGDFRFDLEAGRAAGAYTVHVDPEGAFDWPHLADLQVRSLEALLTATRERS